MRSLWLTGILITLAFAGCLDDGDENGGTTTVPGGDFVAGTVQGTLDLARSVVPTFSESLIIDDVRAGGEPVIAILPTGTIMVSAHPGWTHLHPKDPTTVVTDLVAPTNLQSYLWRSTDNGTTWDHVDLVDGIDNAPRSTALGVSDPEFTVMDDGSICMTDLIALASSSVSCSQDDGQTWLPGNSLASGGVNDRQWLASTGTELYFTANYFVDHHLIASNDYGLTWEIRGDVPCGQDLISNPHTDHLIVGCPDGVAVSEDAGFTWERRPAPGMSTGPRIMAEPAIDSAGNTWLVFQPTEHELVLAGSPDEGLSWPWTIDLVPHFTAYGMDNPHGEDAAGNGTFVWPWLSAGSDGRVAVSWIGSYSDEASDVQSGPWYFFNAYVLEATRATPVVHVTTMTPDPIHLQPICQDGTTCQVASVLGDPSGDRRLGDFFETTIDAEGYLHATWSNTAAEPDDVVSHAQYVRQVDGIRLISDEDLGTWMPTQG